MFGIKKSVFNRRTNSRKARFEPLENRQLLTTYYVSTTGSDSNSGTSSSSPWKSIAHVNAKTFKAGEVDVDRTGTRMPAARPLDQALKLPSALDRPGAG